ncbi:MAG: GNAT family N-acetyltransferase [Solirubrobacteraceae bacterium]
MPAAPLVRGPTALRPWRDTDISELVDLCQDPELSRWTRVPSPYGISDARAYLMARYDALYAGVTAPFAIVAADDDERLLGSTSLMALSWEHARAEIGYWLGREARGHGHATRAVALLCGWGFEHCELQRIELRAATGNLASQRVAERSGFTREAIQRSYFRGRDGRQDVIAFGLLRDERDAVL